MTFEEFQNLNQTKDSDIKRISQKIKNQVGDNFNYLKICSHGRARQSNGIVKQVHSIRTFHLLPLTDGFSC